MRVTNPIAITDAMLASTSVGELDDSVAAWDADTAYVTGDVVYLASTHHNYTRLADGTTPGSPDQDTDNWQDLGPSNRWRMFDLDRSTQTVAASPLEVVLEPGVRAPTLAMIGLVADQVEVQITHDATVVYDQTINLRLRRTTRWSEYFFGSFATKSYIYLDGLTLRLNTQIVITASRAAGDVSIGGVILGKSVYVGKIQYGPNNDATNYSQFNRDDFGNASLVRRRSVPLKDFTVRVKVEDAVKVLALRDDLNAVPALWCALDDPANPWFDPFMTFGVYKRFALQADTPDMGLLTGQVEEY